MKEKSYTPHRFVSRLFPYAADVKVLQSISMENVHNLYRFSLIVSVLEVVALISYLISNWGSPDYLQTVLRVACCILMCLSVALISRRINLRFEKTGCVSHAGTEALGVVFYLLLSLWAIIIDAEHYAAGEQMLTFYIVQFCYLCFVAIDPRVGTPAITLSFLLLYVLLHTHDGAVGVQPQNYFIFAVIAVLGNAIKYSALLTAERNKLDLLELNRILEREAKIDDLTKLKNRNALKKDVALYMGRFIHLVMADVDYFKHYNDEYGHPTGDTVLRLVAECTSAAFPDGQVYRYGGDEFLILLTDCTVEECDARVARWKAALGELRVPGVDSPILCSSGHGWGWMHNRDDYAAIIKIADDRLYEAKRIRAAN